MTAISTPEERGNRLKHIRRNLLSMTRDEFCINASFSLHSLKAWELAWGGGLTTSGAKKISIHLSSKGILCTVTWLMHGVGIAASKMDKRLVTSKGEAEQIAQELLLFKKLPGSIDLIADTDAMVPAIYPGDYVGGVVSQDMDLLINRQCIAVTQEGLMYLGVLKPSDDLGAFNLDYLNEEAVYNCHKLNDVIFSNVAEILWVRRASKK